MAFIGVFTKAKTDIQRGSKSALAVLIGDNIYVGKATGMRGNITKGLFGRLCADRRPEGV